VAVVFILITILAVVVIGLVSVGGVTARLAKAPPRSLFDLDEAVAFVAERLPAYAAGQLSYDELRRVLGWHLEYLEARGVADEDADAGPVVQAAVAGDDEGVAFVLDRAGAAGIDLDDVAVVQALDAEAAYLDAIGALGNRVGTDDT
jgi:hypothetical protein